MPNVGRAGEHVERVAAAARDPRRPQIAVAEEAEDHRVAVRAERVERAPDHRLRRQGHAFEPLRPALDRPLLEHLVSNVDDQQSLRGQIVVPAKARAEALHDLFERARLRDERPARVMPLRELFESDRPIAPRIEATVPGVEELPEAPVFVDGDDPAARSRRLAVRRRARLP